jgi:hypothetical protein
MNEDEIRNMKRQVDGATFKVKVLTPILLISFLTFVITFIFDFQLYSNVIRGLTLILLVIYIQLWKFIFEGHHQMYRSGYYGYGYY